MEFLINNIDITGWFWIFTVLIIIQIIIAVKFDKIAKLKGFYGYGIWVFFFGIFGCLMVVALPNIKVTYNDNNDLPEL